MPGEVSASGYEFNAGPLSGKYKSVSRISAAVRGGRWNLPLSGREWGSRVELRAGNPVETGSPRWEWWGGSDGTPRCDRVRVPLSDVWTPARLPCPVRNPLPACPPPHSNSGSSELSSPDAGEVSGHSRAAAHVPVVTVTHRRLCSATCSP